MIRRLGSIAVLAFAIIVAPTRARAQEVTIAPATSLDPAAVPAVVVPERPAAETATQQPVVGPSLDAATAGFHRAASQTTNAPVTVAAARASNSTALMIVGGVAFLAGAVISGDAGTIIMIGGAAVGLYGLYLYLQ
jgi:hypothetical protein